MRKHISVGMIQCLEISFDTILRLDKSKNNARPLHSNSKQNLRSFIWEQSVLLQCKDIYMYLQALGTFLLQNTMYRVTWQFKSKVWFRNENTRVIQAFHLSRVCDISKWPCRLMYQQCLRWVSVRYLTQNFSIVVGILKYATLKHQPLLAIV